MRIRSFAKINLGLEICGRRPDGYHNIRTLFQSIDLHDRLTFFPSPDPEIRLEGSDKRISWDRDNLIFQAVELIRKRSGCCEGIRINVEKRIPPGGGLGGGSSNAAATLFALNRMWSLNFSRGALRDMGRSLGADVPFFFTGGLCLGTGKGDRIQGLSDPGPLTCVLAWENFPISTASVYRHLPATLTSYGKDSKIIKFLRDQKISGLRNDLEKAVFDLYPQVRKHKRLLLEAGAELALVSGSGSTVFGIFPTRKSAGRAREKMDGQPQITQTLSRREYWEKMIIEDSPGV